MDNYVKGWNSLQRRLRGTTPKFARRVLGSMARAGARIVLVSARGKCVSKTLQKEMKLRKVRLPSKEMVLFKVDPQSPLAHLLEFGTSGHSLVAKAKNKIRGGLITKMPDGSFVRRRLYHPGSRAFPFLRPAMDQNENRAVEAMRKKGEQRMKKAGIK